MPFLTPLKCDSTRQSIHCRRCPQKQESSLTENQTRVKLPHVLIDCLIFKMIITKIYFSVWFYSQRVYTHIPCPGLIRDLHCSEYRRLIWQNSTKGENMEMVKQYKYLERSELRLAENLAIIKIVQKFLEYMKFILVNHHKTSKHILAAFHVCTVARIQSHISHFYYIILQDIMKAPQDNTFTVSHILSPATKDDSVEARSVRQGEKNCQNLCGPLKQVHRQLTYDSINRLMQARREVDTFRGRLVRWQDHQLWIFARRRSFNCYRSCLSIHCESLARQKIKNKI